MINKVQEELDEILYKYGWESVDDIYWLIILTDEKLSEEFIEKFQDKVNWRVISYRQQLSKGFIKKFKHKLDIEYLLGKGQVTQKFLDEPINPFKPKNRFQLLDI